MANDPKARIRALAAKAQEAFDDASLTMAEKKSKIDAINTEIKSAQEEVQLQAEIKSFMADVEGHGDPEDHAEQERPTQAKSIGQRIVESKSYLDSLGTKGKRVAVDLSDVSIKAAGTFMEGQMPAYQGANGSFGAVLQPQFLPDIVPLLFQPLRIEQLMASGATNAMAISYPIETAFNDNTAVVPEGGLKPLLDLSLGRRQDPVVKIANLAKISDEMFEDAPALQSYIENRMIFALGRTTEGQLLNGDGKNGGMVGLLNREGLAAPVTAGPAKNGPAQGLMEAIFNQITAIRTNAFGEPDAIVMHPADWQTIRLAQDANGQYYAGGPFTGAYGNPTPSNVYNLWGLNVVVTTAMPQGKALVGAFGQGAQVFTRKGVTVEMTNSNVDDFQNDLISIRAEVRKALAVYRPGWFGVVQAAAKAS